tara:strand:+ start:2563 stop:3702 length:1140 start_codon:yes stop_codon:yes gene_type:complete
VKINIISKDYLIFEDKRYISFPNLCKGKNGELLCTYRKASEFSFEAAKNNLATHHDPDSSIFLATLDIDDRNNCIIKDNKKIYQTSYGVNDPSITLLRNNNYLIRFVALKITNTKEYIHDKNNKIFSHRVEHGLVTNVVGQVVMKSNDLKDWNEISLVKDINYGPSCGRDPIIELEDGSLLMPGYVGAPARSDISLIHRSFDDGENWNFSSIVAIDKDGEYSQMHGINFNETNLLNCGNGHLIAAIRGDTTFYTSEKTFMPVGGVGKIYISHSHDGGLCWSKPFDSGLFGQPAQLNLLKNGSILMTYGYRKKPYGVRVSISNDFCRTWEEPQLISREFDIWDCGYPSTIQLENNKFLSVYYGADSNLRRGIEYSYWELL